MRFIFGFLDVLSSSRLHDQASLLTAFRVYTTFCPPFASSSSSQHMLCSFAKMLEVRPHVCAARGFRSPLESATEVLHVSSFTQPSKATMPQLCPAAVHVWNSIRRVTMLEQSSLGCKPNQNKCMSCFRIGRFYLFQIRTLLDTWRSELCLRLRATY